MTTKSNPQEIRLLAHNAIAYDAIKESFKTKQRAAIVHATGTGKSYIIARTAQDFFRCLIIAPNDFVLNETRRICPRNCSFKTYAAVMFMDQPETGYDLIVLDEFHRAGADKWGKGVQALLDANPTAKVLGTSANDIRYLDGMRNMADELFEGNVVSRLTLKDAIDMKILPNPTYVSSLYTLDNICNEAETRINDSRRDDDQKAEGLKMLKGIRDSWEKSQGVPGIIRKYIDHDIKRIIVFCADVAMATQCRSMLRDWFKAAGFEDLKFYNINYTNTNLYREMINFQKDGPGIKVAISINMLNEGVHVPNVDAIIMLRGTMSRIIVGQQIGRCLTAKNTGKTPVILDLVNNLEGYNNWGSSPTGVKYEERNLQTDINKQDREKAEAFPFSIIDEAVDIRNLMTDINDRFAKTYWTYETCKLEALKYNKKLDFATGSPGAYNFARYHDILDDICGHMCGKWKRWTLEECIKAARKYKTKAEFKENNMRVYRVCMAKGWLTVACQHMAVQARYTKEDCEKAAKRFSRRIRFQLACQAIYKYAQLHGWIDEICQHMDVVRHTRTFEECRADALKYKTRKEYKKEDINSYTYAQRRGWLNDICKHMPDPTKPPYTRGEVFALARQLSGKTELNRKYYTAYMLARKEGYLNELKFNKKNK